MGAVAEVRVVPGPRTAADVMTTKLVTVSPEDSLLAAWELLSRGRFRHLPVVSGQRCVGILDDRSLAIDWLLGSLASSRRRVGDVVAERVHSVLPDTPLRRVAQVMVEERVTAVPVVDRRLRLVGLVTDTDIVTHVAVGDG